MIDRKTTDAAATLAVAYHAYYEARQEKDDKLALIWAEMLIDAAAVLNVTEMDMPGLALIKDTAKHLRATVTGRRS